MKKNFILLVIIALSNTLYSQDTSSNKFWNGFFKDIEYSKPFISELHSIVNRIEMGYHEEYGPYKLSNSFQLYKRPMVELHLGFDASLYRYDWGKNWSVGLSLPVSMHVLEDMWEPITAAVIDVDYRFGSPKIKAIKSFSNSKLIKNVSVMWLPLFHECTHLGDELVLAVAAIGYPLKRVNVSYEYTELQMTINDPNGSIENNHALRIGGRYRVSNRGYGWFSTESFAIDSSIVELTESTHRFEWNIEYQWQRSKGFLASKYAVNYFSLDVSSRVKLGLPVFLNDNGVWLAKDKEEKNVVTFNAFLGWQFRGSIPKSRSLGLYLHVYKGINYWGQLRNQGNYGYYGIALIYDY
ncbi:MAG: DUF1207 domain-containing protein [Bacteroidales bacterium]|nr:DUF1207 domain-containing protein [Bacteroidales bacterium]